MATWSVEKMQRKKIPSYLIHWTHSFIAQRCCRIHVGESEVVCTPECGLPQGSPLSPTLFLLFIDDLLVELIKTGVDCQAFADDVLVWIQGNFWQGMTSLFPDDGNGNSQGLGATVANDLQSNQMRIYLFCGPPGIDPTIVSSFSTV